MDSRRRRESVGTRGWIRSYPLAYDWLYHVMPVDRSGLPVYGVRSAQADACDAALTLSV